MKQQDMESIAIIEAQLKLGYLDMGAMVYKPEIAFIQKAIAEYKENHKNDKEGDE